MIKEVEAYLRLMSYGQLLTCSGGLFMDVGTYIVAVFCTVEDWLAGEQPLRRRGPKPRLSIWPMHLCL